MSRSPSKKQISSKKFITFKKNHNIGEVLKMSLKQNQLKKAKKNRSSFFEKQKRKKI
jgi:hypothetical protein